MAAIARVEDIEAWKEGRKLVAVVYRLTSQGPWARDFGLRDQIRRAAVSIPCNISEGYGRETDVEFVRFLTIARGSANELKTQLYIALDLEYVETSIFDEVYKRVDKICRMITGFIDYLKKGQRGVRKTVDRRPPTDD